jgi:hypothetical protein
VRLGRTDRDGIAPSMFGLLERGVARRPELARSLRGRVVLRFDEGFAPLRISFGERVVRVEDGDLRRPDLAISGRLPDIVHFATVPLVGGIPDPSDARGRSAIALFARRRVRVEGDRRLARGLLGLLALRG